MDPTAQLVFYPPKDSDELFDALRMKYPHLRTHSERMREAVIEYLVQEQQVPTPTTANSTLTSPWLASMQSMSSGSSTTWSSPELFDMATPSFSPQPQTQPLSRQQSVATTAMCPSNPTPPAIEQMTGVFSLSDAAQPKQRVRRKMTEAEKIEYRKRRIVKACEKCSKRKRKCNHNQPDLETVTASKAPKVTKPSPTAANKKPPIATPQIQQENSVFGASTVDCGESFGSDMSMPELADYSTLFEDDTFPEMSLDGLCMPTEQQWPWSDTPDWTLMDSSTEGLYDVNQTYGGSWLGENIGGRDGDVFDHDMMQITGGGDNKSMLWEHLRTGQEDPTEKQQPTHTPHVHEMHNKEEPQSRQTQWLHEMDEKEAFEYDADYAVPSFDWNQAGLQSNQNWPQNSIHAQEANDTQRYSLPQMTLRLTGTAKAVKAFGSLLPSSSSRKKSRIQSVSLKNVALLALGGFSMAQDLQNHRADGLQPTLCNDPKCVPGREFSYQSSLSKHTRLHHARGDPQTQTMQNTKRSVLDTVITDLTTEDYLRMHTNATPVREDGRETAGRTPKRAVAPHPDATSIASVTAGAVADVERSVKSKIQKSNPDSDSVRVKMPEHRDSAAQQGRQTPSLGEGLTTKASPSTELYLLKRRIPKALHSIVDRNCPSTAFGPLLTTIPEDVDTYRQRDHEREMVISRNSECTEGNKILASGTTWLTLDTVNCSTGGSGAALSSAQPVHTRPVHLSTSGYEANPNRHHVAALARTTSVAVNAARVPSPLATFAAGESYGGAVQSGLPTANPVLTYRLCDHMRRRDHFGRHRSNLASGLMFSLAAFATLILLSFVQTSPATLTLLLLALAAPVPAAKGSEGSVQSVSEAWVPALRDIIENSSWHTALQSRLQQTKRVSAYVQRLLYRGCDTDWREGNDTRKEPRVVVV